MPTATKKKGEDMAFGFENELLAEIERLRDAINEEAGRASWNYDCLTKCEEKVIQRDAEIARLRLTDAERPLGDPEIAAEILRLRVAELEEAIRRLADQDATLSVVGGNVIVEMDATLTDAEREAIESAIWDYEQNDDDEGCARMVSTLRGLLARCAIGREGRDGT